MNGGHVKGKKRAKAAPAIPAIEKPEILTPIHKRLEKIYGAVPSIPFLDKPTSVLVYASFIIYTLFVAAVFLSTQPLDLKTEFSEAPLYKNTGALLLPGERYEYAIFGPESNERVSYEIRSSPLCPGVLLTGSSSKETACVLGDGTEYGMPTGRRTNASIGNGSFLIFSPWMLAVSDDFDWQLQERVYSSSVQTTMSLRFLSLGKKTIAGREAYEIALSSGLNGMQMADTAKQRLFIDSQKRVLLLAQLGNISARLVSAPFSLNWSDS